MKFTSTRSRSKLYSFETALFSGYAPDGGLFVPEQMPTVDPTKLKSWSSLSYVDLATEVLSLFIDEVEIPSQDLKILLQQAFSGFIDDTVPVVRLAENCFVVELFHGPTFCFKDLGLRALVNLLDYFFSRRQKKVTLIVSTTGDTGPAAVRAVQDSNSKNLGILVHYPEGQISDFQRKQLTTVSSPNVRIATFQGGGDDMDNPIKNLISDGSSRSDRFICGVNSFNIGRPLVQMIHFIWAYLRVIEKLGIEPGDPGM